MVLFKKISTSLVLYSGFSNSKKLLAVFSVHKYFWYNIMEERSNFNSNDFKVTLTSSALKEEHEKKTSISHGPCFFKFISPMVKITDSSSDFSSNSSIKSTDSTGDEKSDYICLNSSDDSILPLSPFRKLQANTSTALDVTIVPENCASDSSFRIEFIDQLDSKNLDLESSCKESSSQTSEDETSNQNKNEKYDNSTTNYSNHANEGKVNRKPDTPRTKKGGTRIELTHFISIPLTDENFQKNFTAFKELVLKNCKQDRGICERLFTKQERLHLTIGVLTLLEEEEVQKALKLLETCKETIVKPVLKEKQLPLLMKGLGFFGSNPKTAKVLFADVIHPDDPTLIETMCNDIKLKFVKEGLISKEKEVKLTVHATLMKTTYSTRFKPFNVENILKMYKDYSFGEGVASQIDLSLFVSGEKNKYYKSAGTVFFAEL